VAGPAKGGEQVEPAGLEARLPQRAVGEVRGAEEPAKGGERRHVEVGPLPPPLPRDAVEMVSHR